MFTSGTAKKINVFQKFFKKVLTNWKKYGIISM